MFENLELIQVIDKQSSLFKAIKKETFTPLLKDTAYMNEIWRMTEASRGVSKTEERQVFLFVALLFYSPGKIIGGKIAKDVMRNICRLTRCKVSLISHNAQNLLFLYYHYDSFRDAVASLINDTIYMLVNDGVSREKIMDYLRKFGNHAEEKEKP